MLHASSLRVLVRVKKQLSLAVDKFGKCTIQLHSTAAAASGTCNIHSHFVLCDACLHHTAHAV